MECCARLDHELAVITVVAGDRKTTSCFGDGGVDQNV